MKKEIILLLSCISITPFIQSAYSRRVNQPTQRIITTRTPTATQPNTATSIGTSTTTSVKSGTISINIYYTEADQLFNKNRTLTMNLEGPFTLQNLQSGLSLHVAVYPPPTTANKSTSSFAQQQQKPSYLIVAFLRSNDGTIVSRQEQKIALSTPPSNMSVSYAGNQISSNKTLFEVDTRLSTSSNKVFFNKNAPLIKNFFIQKTNSGIIAK